MSMVYKCDRCGRVIEETFNGGGNGPFVWDGTMSKDQEYFDLCETCYKSLIHWLDKKKYKSIKNGDCSNCKYANIDERTMALDSVKVNQILNKTKELDEKVKILMERTVIDYGKPESVEAVCVRKSVEAVCIQNVYNRMANRGATREELDSFRNLIHKYNALEYTANKEAKND